MLMDAPTRTLGAGVRPQPETSVDGVNISADGIEHATTAVDGGDLAVAITTKFQLFETVTIGTQPGLSPQLERYIAAAGDVLRPSDRRDVPLGYEPDDYPVN